MRIPAIAVCLLALCAGSAVSQQRTLKSPDGRTTINVTPGAQLSYSVTRSATTIIAASAISLTLADGRVLGPGARVRRARQRTVDTVLRPTVAEKNALIRDHFNELRLEFGDFALLLRAYDDAVAYRFATAFADSVTVAAEQVTFAVATTTTVFFGQDTSFFSHQEPAFAQLPADSVPVGFMSVVPLTIRLADGRLIAITESALEDYAGMHIARTGAGIFNGVFPRVVLEQDEAAARDVVVRKRADYIARTAGKREFPWRIVAIADRDRDLLENQIVYKLAPELRLSDVSWIHPGKVAWDWWNALNLHGVGFRAGINTATYKYYIDFAARYRIPYIILDEGWSPVADVTTVVPALDLPQLVEYGRPKQVGIILWSLWRPIDRDMDRILDTWQGWGVQGIKVDFMQRDDQQLVQYYWRLARAAAQRHLLVDYHGAYKPAGLSRAYPNVLTREGVRGLEWNKWSTSITPEHDVTLPFTRMFAGAMDYTPGAMINAAKDEFRPVFSRPMSQGTRAHQLALYVIFESPLQMLADNPVHYLEQADAMSFLAAVPTTWDETRALDAHAGDYVLMARRSGAEWYVGAITDWTARTLELDLSFLPEGRHRMQIWRDGVNADRYGNDYVLEERTVTRSDRLRIELAAGGGWAARIRP